MQKSRRVTTSEMHSAMSINTRTVVTTGVGPSRVTVKVQLDKHLLSCFHKMINHRGESGTHVGGSKVEVLVCGGKRHTTEGEWPSGTLTEQQVVGDLHNGPDT